MEAANEVVKRRLYGGKGLTFGSTVAQWCRPFTSFMFSPLLKTLLEPLNNPLNYSIPSWTPFTQVSQLRCCKCGMKEIWELFGGGVEMPSNVYTKEAALMCSCK